MNAIKKTVALLMAASFIFALSACKNNNQPETTVVPTQTQSQTVITPESSTVIPVSDEADVETSIEITAEATTVAETTTEAPATTQVPTTTKAVTTTKKAVTTTKKAVTTTKKAVITTKKPVVTTKIAATTKKQTAAPTSKADIVKLYNSAASAASSAKPGYSKSTVTTLSNLEMGALANIGAVREAIGSFLGEGSSTETVAKGNFNGTSLVKSTLKESDVTSASCKLSDDGKYYTVNITVRNETNPKKNGSALGRFTKDFKDVDEVKAGLAEAGASADSMTIETTSVTITAKISVSNNRFVSLSHNIKMKANLSNIKYTIVRVSKASMNLETKISYSDFKY